MTINTVVWHWQQWTIVTFCLFVILANIALNGKSKTGVHNGVVGAAFLIAEAAVFISAGFLS